MRPIIIIGLTCQGLSLLRALSRVGLHVIAFTENKRNKEVGYYSKYGEKRLFSSLDDLKNQLTELAKQYQDGERLKCLIASGTDLSAILRFFPEIYDLFDMEPAPKRTVELFSHKNRCYERCAELNIPHAEYRLLSEYREGDLQFPLILKKNYEIKTFFKTKIVHTLDDFNAFVESIPQDQFPDIIIQEWIQAKKKRELSCQMYLKEGKIVAFLPSVQPSRLKKGLTSYLVELTDQKFCEKLRSICRSILSDVDYTGFIEFEFLEDDLNTIFFIEINPRPCGLNSSMFYKYPNLASVYTSSNIDIQPISSVVKWVNIQRDLRVAWERKTFPHFYRLIASKHDVFDWKDLKPFFFQFFKGLF